MADRILPVSSRSRADELAGVGVWSLDLASGLLTTNPAARSMLGWREGREYVLEHRALLPDGRVLHLRASGVADLDEDGRPRMLHGVTLDLGHRD